MLLTYTEGWLRLAGNDRRQHYFRDGMSVCGRFVTPTTEYPEDDGPDRGECRACRTIFDIELGPTRY